MQIFDVAVIGAGPAGAVAATYAARTGCKVCLLERKETVGIPVRCGEGIGHQSLLNHIVAKDEWIKNTTKKSVMVSPSGIRVEIESIEDSYILDRKLMDSDLVKEAISSGASYFSSTPVISIKRIETGYECYTPKETFKSSLVILADGVESKLARSLGWNTTLALEDIETSAFARVISPFVDKQACVFFTGSRVAPGGYAWIFPKGTGEANVGLGISGTNSSAGKAKEYLLRFIDSEFPASKVFDIHCGGIPVARYMRPLVSFGAMLVGDAARQVNCLSGAGLGYSFYAGKLCGTIAGEAVKGGAVDINHLKEYERIWKKGFGKQQDRSYALKKFVAQYADDPFLDKIAASLSKEKPSKMNYLRVFMKTFKGHPILLFKVMKLFR